MEGGNVARELLDRAFNPHIAVISSPQAQALCQKNNLNFTQLISPFTALTTSLYWHEPGGTQIIPRYLTITPVDLATWTPPRPDLYRIKKKQLLQNQVAKIVPYFYPDNYDPHDHSSQSTQSYPANISYKLGKPGLTKDYTVEVPSSTPWFDSWRNTLLKSQSESQVTQHEFINHFMGCILVISSAEGKSVEELSIIIGNLSKLQLQHQTEWPNSWFLPSILKFYLILHDNSVGDANSAEILYQSLRTTYTGNACHLLKINSGKDLSHRIGKNIWSAVIDQEQSGSGLDRNDETFNGNEGLEQVNIVHGLPHPLSPEDEFTPFFENGVVAGMEDEKDRIEMSARGQCMTSDDMQSVQIAVNEFITKALLPYVERQTRILHESVWRKD